MQQDEDFLDELIAERTKRNPAFPQMVEDALRRRKAQRAHQSQKGAALPAGQTDEQDKATPTPIPAHAE